MGVDLGDFQFKDICGPSKSGLRLVLTIDGKLFFLHKNQWERYDFNRFYEGYYPACNFTAIAYTGDVFYISGVDDSARPHVFTSLMGNVWEEENLTMLHPLYGQVHTSGKILRILYDSTSEQIFLICQNGQLVTLPDCPKCVRIQQVGNAEVVDGEIEGNDIVIQFLDNTQNHIPLEEVSQYRVSRSYFREKLASCCQLVDLRTKQEYLQDGLQGSINIPLDQIYDWLKTERKQETLVFVCRNGIQADMAAAYARSHEFTHAYSLGGMKAFTHVE